MPEFEQTIGESRQKILTLQHLERIRAEENGLYNLDDLTENDESNMYSNEGDFDFANDDAEDV